MKNVLVFAVVATLFLYAYAKPAEDPAPVGAVKQAANATAAAVPGATNSSIDAAANVAKDAVGKATDAAKPATAGTGLFGGIIQFGLNLATGVASFISG